MTTATEQRRQAAFAAAARTRTVWADIERELSDGTITLAGVFDRSEADATMAAIKLLPLLEATPQLGKVASRRLLADLGLDDRITVAALDADARIELTARVGGSS